MRPLIPVLPVLLASFLETYAQATPSLPVGMNLHGPTCYGPPIFVDAMKSAGDRISFPADGEYPRDTPPADSISKESDGHSLELPFAVTPGARVPPPSARRVGGLEGRVKGRQLILDWAATARPPAEFRILRPDGRVIASRRGRRSAQGWIAAVRVAGWPRGVYLAEVRSGGLAASAKIPVP